MEKQMGESIVCHDSMPKRPSKIKTAGGKKNFTEALAAFDYQPRTRLVVGTNSSERIGELAAQLGGKKVLLVTDRGIVAAGHAEKIRRNLEMAGIKVALYDHARENPTTSDVTRCVEFAQREKIDSLIGLGGGSSMDTAKGCNFILTNGGRMQDYWGVGKAKKPMLPLIAIPTTAGTGSECQSAALITDEETHQKMACLDPKAAARIAILDPTLTLSQPPRVTACTGIDAIAHAVETAVTQKRNPLSLIFSREAFALCAAAFPEVLRNPGNLAAREKMQLGAAFAGVAIENSMLGAAHAAANPLTAHYGIIHGHAVGLMLAHVVRFNAQEPTVRKNYETFSGRTVDELQKLLQSLMKLTQLPTALQDCGVKRSKIPSLAEEASRQWTASFNPRPVTREDFIQLYEAAFES
jgi:alcohol dehydrogenase